MEITSRPLNIFVFGDLVLDHIIRIANKDQPFQAAGSEEVYDATSRATLAGGAANCARAIASINTGRTSLWGLTGHSPWGTFVEVLQESQSIDGAEQRIVFHGVHDESRQMNTVSRMVNVGSDKRPFRKLRFDDIPYVLATEHQIRHALDRLNSEHEKHKVDAIIINDLDMGAVTSSLVQGIAEFAKDNGVPLFVDPKRDWNKYRRVNVTCALPNLKEWCYLVDEAGHEREWGKDLTDLENLKRMAVRSLRYMPNAAIHIIKCEAEGAVLIAPHDIGNYKIYHFMPHSSQHPDQPYQLGSGDVMAAVLCLEYAARKDHAGEDRLVQSFEIANAVVACYRESDWHRMPNLREVRRFQRSKLSQPETALLAAGLLYLPDKETRTNYLEDVSIEGSSLLSVDNDYRSEISKLVDFLCKHWDVESPKSAILTARGGSGKSKIIRVLRDRLAEIDVEVRSFEEASRSARSVDDVPRQVREICSRLPENTKGLLLYIDEAFSAAKHLLVGDWGKLLLQTVSKEETSTRFLFIDASFDEVKPNLSNSQFLSRCIVFRLPSIEKRPWDIPYIFALACLKQLKKFGHNRVRISEAVLLSVVNQLLSLSPDDRNSRRVVSAAEEMVSRLPLNVKQGERIVELSKRYLSDELRPHVGYTEASKILLEFQAGDRLLK